MTKTAGKGKARTAQTADDAAQAPAQARTRKGPGRPLGSHNAISKRVLSELEAMTDDVSAALRAKIADGDVAAMRLVLDRICPARRDAPLPKVTLPEGLAVTDLPAMSMAVVRAAADGKLSPQEVTAYSALLTAHQHCLVQAAAFALPDDAGTVVSEDEIERRAAELRAEIERQRSEFRPQRQLDVQRLREEARAADSFSVEATVSMEGDGLGDGR